MSQLIYKVVSRSAWEAAIASGTFTGAEIDLADGYIHFSSGAQLAETLRLHFAGQEDLVLVAVDTDSLGDRLKWEASRGGALFPHLYSPLGVEKAVSVHALELRDGVHVLPDGIAS